MNGIDLKKEKKERGAAFLSGNSVVDCRFLSLNCPLVEAGTIDGTISVRFFLRDPKPYL